MSTMPIEFQKAHQLYNVGKFNESGQVCLTILKINPTTENIGASIYNTTNLTKNICSNVNAYAIKANKSYSQLKLIIILIVLSTETPLMVLSDNNLTKHLFSV